MSKKPCYIKRLERRRIKREEVAKQQQQEAEAVKSQAELQSPEAPKVAEADNGEGN